MGFKDICPDFPQNSIQNAKCPGVFKATIIIIIMSDEYFDCPMVGRSVYGCRTAIDQPLTGRKRGR